MEGGGAKVAKASVNTSGAARFPARVTGAKALHAGTRPPFLRDGDCGRPALIKY